MYDGDERAGVLVMEVDEETGGIRRVEPPTYIVNPERRDLAVMVNQFNKIEWPVNKDPANPDRERALKPANGQFMYAVDANGNVFIGSRAGQRMPHPTLVGGPDPQVRAAGIIEIRGGKVYSVNNESGHFQPGPASLDAAAEALNRILPPKAFHKDYKGPELFQPRT